MSVENIINEWDPYSLQPYCPKDEYKQEIELINKFIKINKNENELVLFLKNIFDDDMIFKDKDFLEISKKILKEKA